MKKSESRAFTLGSPWLRAQLLIAGKEGQTKNFAGMDLLRVLHNGHIGKEQGKRVPGIKVAFFCLHFHGENQI